VAEQLTVSPRIGGGAQTLGVIGWPVHHSLSPAIHNAAFAALDLGWIYVPLPVPPGRVAEALSGLHALGFRGANVTMPHKTEVAERVDTLSDDASRLRAVNTIELVDGQTVCHNTDAPGFDRFLRRDAGFDPDGRSALLYGAGGAARACALALANAGLARLTVAVREIDRAGDLRHALKGLPTEVIAVPFDAAAEHPTDLLVNATPLGAGGEELPLPAIDGATVAIDLLYHPAFTPLQARVRAAGGRAFNGMGLLLQQAALAFELWTGRVAPLDVMSAAALAAIADQP
jgi:shikimate dehydrogenase